MWQKLKERKHDFTGNHRCITTAKTQICKIIKWKSAVPWKSCIPELNFIRTSLSTHKQKYPVYALKSAQNNRNKWCIKILFTHESHE